MCVVGCTHKAPHVRGSGTLPKPDASVNTFSVLQFLHLIVTETALGRVREELMTMPGTRTRRFTSSACRCGSTTRTSVT